MKKPLDVVAGTLCVFLIVPAFAQQKGEKIDAGKREFESNCASCHGVSGKGNGPVTDLLKKSPPDLTLLAKNNGGVLPVARLYDVIDGAGVPAHGSRDMPIWGREYRVQAGEHYGEVPYDPEAYVRGRILMLIDYLNRIQQK